MQRDRRQETRLTPEEEADCFKQQWGRHYPVGKGILEKLEFIYSVWRMGRGDSRDGAWVEQGTGLSGH